MLTNKSLCILSVFLFLLCFAVFPWFSNVNTPAKAYVFFFFSVVVFLKKILQKSSIVLDSSFPLWILLFFSFSVSAVMSKDIASALIFVAMILAAILFFFWVRTLSWAYPNAGEMVVGTIALTAVVFAVFGLVQFCNYAVNGRSQHMIIPYLLPESWGVRVSGPFGQPNFHALMMVTGLCAHAYILYSKVWERRTFWVKFGYFLPVGLLLVNFFLTDSRGGKVGAGVLLICIAFFVYRQRSRFKLKIYLKRSICFAVVALFAWGIVKGTIFTLVSDETLSVMSAAQTGSIASRINTWTSSLLMFAKHPLFGIGPDNFKGYLYEYQIKANELLHFEYEDMLYTRWAHNEYLQVLAEGGLFAFVPLMLLIFSISRRILDKLHSTKDFNRIFLYLSPIPFFVQAAFDWPLRHPSLLAFCLVLVAFSLPQEGFVEIPLTCWRKWAISFLLVLLLGGGLWAVYWECQVGFLKQKVSDESLVNDNFNRMRDLARNPVVEFTVLNEGTLPFIRYAIKKQDTNLANALLPLLKRGIYLEGPFWQWYNLSRILLVAGKEEDAKRAVRKALELNPIYQPAWGFLHYLDVLDVSKKTGRSVAELLPKRLNEQELLDVHSFPPTGH